ncbi:MAG: hypothetical protein WBO24_09665, partial [Nitrospirales bacterium]
SYNALPINAETAFFLDRFKSYLRDHTATADGVQRDTRREIWMETQSIVEALLLPEYHSYDHLAHEVWLNGPDDEFPRRIPNGVFPKDLARIKVLMSVYYFFEQVRNKSLDDPRKMPLEQTKHAAPPTTDINRELTNVDERQKVFLRELLALGNGKIPDRVHMLTWNYDIQLLMAYANQIGENSLVRCMQSDRLNVHPGRVPRFAHDEPSLVHVNGVAGLINNLDTGEIRLMNYGKEVGTLNLADLIAQNQSLKWMLLLMENVWSIHETFSFAWEDFWSTRLTHKYMARFGQITRDLVVVGYSFPDDNARTDLKFFKTYVGFGALEPKRIFLVSPSPNADQLKKRLDSLRGRLNFPPDCTYTVAIYLVPLGDRIPLPNELDMLATTYVPEIWEHTVPDPFSAHP